MKAHLHLTAKKIVDFKGTLLQALHKPGQKYALLLYRTDKGLRYCLSKDLKKVKTMHIGQAYRVKGREYTTGHKTFLNIVSVSPQLPLAARIKRGAGIMAGAMSVLVLAGSVFTGYLWQQEERRLNSKDSAESTIQTQEGTSQLYKPTKKSRARAQETPGPVTPDTARNSTPSTEPTQRKTTSTQKVVPELVVVPEPVKVPEPTSAETAMPVITPEPVVIPVTPQPDTTKTPSLGSDSVSTESVVTETPTE